MLNFRSADAKTQSTDSSVSCRMAVAADHNHAGAHEPLLLHHDVFNSLKWAVRSVESSNTEAPAISFERLCLNERGFIVNAARRLVMSWNDVVHDTEVRVGTEHIDFSFDESRKGLRRGVLVGKVNITVE